MIPVPKPQAVLHWENPGNVAETMKKEMMERTEVKKSKIPKAGDGLFVTEDVKRGTPLAWYHGEVIGERHLEKLRGKPAGQYIIALPGGLYMNGRKGAAEARGHLVNSGQRRNNARIKIDSLHKRVLVRATRDLKKGAEILVPYGAAFKLPAPQTDFPPALNLDSPRAGHRWVRMTVAVTRTGLDGRLLLKEEHGRVHCPSRILEKDEKIDDTLLKDWAKSVLEDEAAVHEADLGRYTHLATLTRDSGNGIPWRNMWLVSN